MLKRIFLFLIPWDHTFRHLFFLFSLLNILIFPIISYSDDSSTIGGKTSSSHIIQDEGTSLRPRPYLNITGSGVSCSDSSGKTVCDISGGAGTPGGNPTQVQFHSPSGSFTGDTGFIFNATDDSVVLAGQASADSVYAVTTIHIPTDTAPTVDDLGEMALDTNFLAAGRGAFLYWDGTAVNQIIGCLASDAESLGQVCKSNGDGTHTWENDNNSAAPAGTDTRVAFFDGISIGDDPDFTFNKITNELSVGTVETDAVEDPRVGFSPSATGDSVFSIGVNADGSGDNDDYFEIRKNLVPGAGVVASVDSAGLTTIYNFALKDATTDDTVLLANGYQYIARALTDCDDSAGNHLNYDTTTNTFSCGTSGDGGGVSSVSATFPVASSGGTTPVISLGVVKAANGGVGYAGATDDTISLADGTAWRNKALSLGIASYDTATNAFSAVTDGRSINIASGKIDADAELYTDTKCIYWENPIETDDFKSIWYTPIAATITSIWAESDQTVTFMWQVDDGSPADVDSVDLAPAAGVASDTSLDGDATMAAGDRLDMAVTSVTNTPSRVSACFTYTLDD